MMTLNYLLETGFCWLFFYLLYAFWLGKETFFRANRMYLISTLLLGLLIPAIDFMPTQQPVVIQDFTVYLNEVTVLAQGNPASFDAEFHIGAILVLIYKMGVAICLFRFLIGMGSIARLFINSHIIKKENYTLVYTTYKHAPFSFLHFFFVYKEMNFSEAEWQQITRHEEAHIRGVHTLDVLLMEVVAIVFWFNPLIYFYKNAIRNVHEYLADAAVIKTVPMAHYGRFLVSVALPGFRMANNFNHSQLKKRIIMMTKTQSSKFALAKYMLFIPLALLMLLVFSCKEEVENIEAQARATTKQTTTKKQSDDLAERLKPHKAEFDQRAIEIDAEKDPVKKKAMINAIENDIKEKLKIKGSLDLGFSREAGIYTIVDEMPRFPGCEDKAGDERKKCAEMQMLQHIYTNVVYPAEAKNAGIEGMAVASFVVESDGQISDAKIVRGMGYGTDKEVLRIINNMPNWIPGKQEGEAVRVKYNLPVRFKLEG